MTTAQPFIGIVQGDACGIGPELLSKLLRKLKAAERNRVLVISDQRIMTAGDAVAGQETLCKRLNEPTEIDRDRGQPQLLDVRCLDPANIVPGTVSVDAGRAVLETFGLAIDLAQSGIRLQCILPESVSPTS